MSTEPIGERAAERLSGRVLSPGEASGRALVLSDPLSLWGGMDPATGDVVEPRHPQHGANLRGRIVVLPAARGSSSSSSILAEAARAGTAPAALLLGEPDLILAVGAAVADELYGVRIPVVHLAPAALARVPDGQPARVLPNGVVEVSGVARTASPGT